MTLTNHGNMKWALWIVALLMAGCSQSDVSVSPGTIEGQIAGLDKNMEVVLRSFKEGNLVNVASTKADSSGSFVLTPDPPLTRGYHQLLAGNRHPLVLITDQSEGMYIKANISSELTYLVGAQISGSPESAMLSEYYDVVMPLQNRMQAAERNGRSLDANKRAAAKEELASATDSMIAVSLAFAEGHKSSLAALSALESLDAKAHKALFKSILDNLKDAYSRSHYYGIIRKQFTEANLPRNLDNLPNPTSQKKFSKNGKFTQGDMAPDIVMNDPSGQEIKLSSLRGKVVLLDFWASWCGPCRRENPNVVRAYDKYKDQGFEVFSVSLDSDANRWRAAIEQDQLKWPYHVSDLAGWRNAAAREYGISSIPHTMLIDRDGSILATHLRGGGVESALRGVFEK